MLPLSSSPRLLFSVLCLLPFVLCLLCGSVAHAQDGFPVAAGTGLTPEAAAKAMTLPPGFRATAFAGEPDVHQPITFTIDERGRLWVVENYAYPHWSPYGRDRIIILEDTDGDGRFNTRKVFYDQLNFGSGIAVGHGGVWVGSPPYLLFIPDKNRDDVPDGPPVPVLDGWGHEDTHETLNSFIWGPDGWLYGNQGVFTHSNVGKPSARDADRHPLNACVWRYHPTKKIFEIFAAGMSNQWGLDFNDVGDAFATACVIPHLYHVVQGGYYQRQAGQHFNPYVYDDIKTIADHAHYDKGVKWQDARFQAGGTDASGGGHAHCGTVIYLGDSFPAQYRGALFTHNVLGSRINQEKLVATGSGYIGSHAPDFMKANDNWFRGLRLEVGPDGSVFNSDWYDARACHQQHPQDRSNGRIYKISYGETKPVRVDLHKHTSAELVQLQLHANEYFVRRARVILQERGPDPAVHVALTKIIRENKDVTRQLRALWALHATRGITDALALEFLQSPEAYVRGWTIQLTCEDKSPSAALLTAFADLAKSDPSPIVRRFLASAAQRIAVAKRWSVVEALLAHGEDAKDHNLPLMYWFAAEPLVPADPNRALALGTKTPLTALRPFFTKRQAALSDVAGATNQRGAPTGIAALLAAAAESNDANYHREIVDGVLSATEGKTNVTPPREWAAAYAKLGESHDPAVIAKADTLATRFGDKTVVLAKRRIVTDNFAPLAARQAALNVLIEQHNFQLTPIYQSLLPEPGLRIGALKGLAAYDVPTTVGAILGNYATFTSEEKRAAISVLAGRAAYARELLAAVKAGAIARSDLDSSLARQLRLLKDPEVDRAVADVFGIVKESPEAAAQEITKWKSILTPQRLAAASPSRGRVVFERTCAMCHVLFENGKHIGPELTGSNRGELDYVLNNVVDPNAIIGKDYQLTTIETNDGRTAAGVVQRETPSTVTIANMAETVTFSRDNIKKLERHEVSLMPPGLFQSMKEAEVADLVAYLRSERQVDLP